MHVCLPDNLKQHQMVFDLEARSLVLESLRRRVFKACTSAQAMIPASISSRRRRPWLSRLRGLAEATRGRRQVRMEARGPMEKHIMVAQLWRTLSRVQLQPDLHEQSRCVHELLYFLTSNEEEEEW